MAEIPFALMESGVMDDAQIMQRLQSGPVSLPVSPGEFFDRLTILWVKRDRIPEKFAQLVDQRKRLEAALLGADYCRQDRCPRYQGPATLQPLIEELYQVNCRLWDIEDRIRALDKDVFPVGDLENLNDEEIEALQEYLSLARGVYVTNTRRGELKAAINRACGQTPEAQKYKEFQRGEERPSS